MKTDIRINYSVLEEIKSKIETYKSAIETMENVLNNINKRLESGNSGKSIDALKGNHGDLQGKISSCKKELTDLYNIFAGYIKEMKEIIEPIEIKERMQVDRTDIYCNMKTIFIACEAIGTPPTMNFAEMTLSLSDEELRKQKSNGRKMGEIFDIIKAYDGILSQDVEEMKNLFNNKIVPYENKDDEYADKAGNMYADYTNTWERISQNFCNDVKNIGNIIYGLGKSIIDLFVGIFKMGAGIIVYEVGLRSTIISAVTGYKGYKPDCLKYCENEFHKDNQMIKAILDDPFLIVEGISQEVSDCYEEKGLAYCGGYTTGLVLQTIFLKKVKFGKVGEVGEAGKGIEKLTQAEIRERVLKRINESRAGREASTYKEFAEFEKRFKEVTKATDELIENAKKIIKFDNPDDPLRDVFGRGSESNPEEWNKLIKELEENGVEVVPREGAMGYGPLRKGEPGQILIDPDASMSALRHEYSHFLEAKANGFPSAAESYQNWEARIADELKAYNIEIEEAKRLGLDNVVEQLQKNFEVEKQSIIKNYGPIE